MPHRRRFELVDAQRIAGLQQVKSGRGGWKIEDGGWRIEDRGWRWVLLGRRRSRASRQCGPKLELGTEDSSILQRASSPPAGKTLVPCRTVIGGKRGLG